MVYEIGTTYRMYGMDKRYTQNFSRKTRTEENTLEI
jgi:hypothetical protein